MVRTVELTEDEIKQAIEYWLLKKHAMVIKVSGDITLALSNGIRAIGVEGITAICKYIPDNGLHE